MRINKKLHYCTSCKGVSNVSVLPALNIFCDKIYSSLLPYLNVTCLAVLHNLEKVHCKLSKITFVLYVMAQKSFLNYPPCTVWKVVGAVWKYGSVMTHECCRFRPTWAVQEKQRKEKLKINHCWRATYIKLHSSFKMCFVHYISVINVHLDFDKVRYSLRNVMHYSFTQTSSGCWTIP